MQAILPYLYAFLVGGAFCLIGQVLIDRTKLTPARILSGYVVAEQGLQGALVGGLQKGAAGIAAAILFSVLAALIFRSKDQC